MQIGGRVLITESLYRTLDHADIDPNRSAMSSYLSLK